MSVPSRPERAPGPLCGRPHRRENERTRAENGTDDLRDAAGVVAVAGAAAPGRPVRADPASAREGGRPLREPRRREGRARRRRAPPPPPAAAAPWRRPRRADRRRRAAERGHHAALRATNDHPRDRRVAVDARDRRGALAARGGARGGEGVRRRATLRRARRHRRLRRLGLDRAEADARTGGTSSRRSTGCSSSSTRRSAAGIIVSLAALFPDDAAELEAANTSGAPARDSPKSAPIDRPRPEAKKEWKPVPPGRTTTARSFC